MLDVLLVEGLVGSASALTLAIVAVRPRVRRAAVPPLARYVARLPGRHRRRVRRIVALARDYEARHPGDAPDAFTVRETLMRYLPETIDAYLAVPKALRAVRIDGRSRADDEFVRQLRTLRGGLERLQAVDGRAAASRLAANGSFLDERFGPPDPPSPADVAPLAGDLLRLAFAAWTQRDGRRPGPHPRT